MQKSRLNSLTLTLSRREREQKAAVFDIARLPSAAKPYLNTSAEFIDIFFRRK
jgi:hypothetical protein